ncbi:hypothetical protein Jden_0377 [Jonesia denitrificans DSM 20603]|uniref:Uncharacterized protein n=1 Tax=Jonesia denitrificans (strain ATCC 14870 / DSM 20603 / BCRC 15368 / CIP 55.134 / JCM 11481 / NBRC 15587 / NCTC 10816 / Prevot 55134) TaxID=471856 RepID=C7QZP0_JONDD|nr:hypothetical protein Jden_0377 [Jonesia denitrificans DSM 20603]
MITVAGVGAVLTGPLGGEAWVLRHEKVTVSLFPLTGGRWEIYVCVHVHRSEEAVTLPVSVHVHT